MQNTKINYIYNYFLSIHMFKLTLRGNAPPRNHNHNTRFRNLALPSYRRLTPTQHAVSFAALKMWNSFPSDMREHRFVPVFGRSSKAYLLFYYLRWCFANLVLVFVGIPCYFLPHTICSWLLGMRDSVFLVWGGWIGTEGPGKAINYVMVVYICIAIIKNVVQLRCRRGEGRVGGGKVGGGKVGGGEGTRSRICCFQKCFLADRSGKLITKYSHEKEFLSRSLTDSLSLSR